MYSSQHPLAPYECDIRNVWYQQWSNQEPKPEILCTQEESRQLTHLANLKAQETHWVPVHRLSAEVLENIFLFLMFGYPPSRTAHGPFYQSDLGWIKVVHVCRHWRTIAFNYSPLWTRISTSSISIPWAHILARCSKERPLSVVMGLLGGAQIEPPYIGRCHLTEPSVFSRIRHLRLEMINWEAYETLVSMFKRTCPIPLLETLTIIRDRADPHLRHSTIPQSSFPLGAPRLYSLRLQDCCWFPVTSASSFTNIFHLQIEFGGGIASSIIHSRVYAHSFDGIAHSLERLTRLKTLILHNFVATRWPLVQNVELPTPWVKLSKRLVKFQLSGPTPQCIRFVSMLIIPPKTRTRIFFLGDHNLDLHVLLKRFGGPERPPRTLLVDLSMTSDVSLQLWDDRRDRSCVQADTASFTVDVSRATLSNSSSVFDQLLRGLCMEELTDVFFETSPWRTWTCKQWLQTFMCARKVKAVYLRGEPCAESFLEALRFVADAPPADKEPDEGKEKENETNSVEAASLVSRVLFPCLDTIGFSDVAIPNFYNGQTVFEAEIHRWFARQQALGVLLCQLETPPEYLQCRRRYAWLFCPAAVRSDEPALPGKALPGKAFQAYVRDSVMLEKEVKSRPSWADDDMI
ncbi:hypothetical protein BV25DRAFT_1916977 [Artomyces pyxidatus]|uniref:Uncharacterized protein n=1 Tax=Artomyces pyxidatus TaxID=48021 RepID=A0ACB8SYZ8_9AGAM|nr:hypothetical protein BV25DRAFT_1916977 [Artomyces pyxidatus]